MEKSKWEVSVLKLCNSTPLLGPLLSSLLTFNLGTESRVLMQIFKKTQFFCLVNRVRHFGTFLNPQVASTVGY